MGCGCCEVNYRDEVENIIIPYIKSINKTEATKRILIDEIKSDLSKRASTVEKYYYPYRGEDV